MSRRVQADSKTKRTSLASGAASLLKFTVTAGLVIFISIPVIGLSGSRERNYCTDYSDAPAGIILIAHAGGGLEQGDYSNSKEALDQAVSNGIRLFELDFNWTSDGELAIGHDWKAEYRYWNRLGWGDWLKSFYSTPSSRSFAASTPSFGLTRLTPASLIDWLQTNPGWIVTDFKADNLAGLALIASRAGSLQHRFIPQIYDMSEYDAVRKMGYEDIILTTYRLSPDTDMLRQIDALELYAVTVPKDFVSEASKVVSSNRIFTHTLNTPVTLPATGYYTDCLVPAKTPSGA